MNKIKIIKRRKRRWNIYIAVTLYALETRYQAHDIRVSVHVVAVKRFYDGPRCFLRGFHR